MDNKRILIDFRHINKKTGFASVLIMILKAIDTTDKEFFLLLNYDKFNFDEYLKNNKNVKFIYAKSKPFSISQNWEIPLILRKNNITIFHAINFDIPLFMFLCPKCKIISTIHDLIPLTHKHLHKRSILKNIYFSFMFKACAILSNKIIAVSFYTKNEIIKYLNVKSQKIEVVHNSYIGKETTKKEKLEFNKPIKLLFIGSNFEHKNIMAVVMAVKILKEKNIDVMFEIAGMETEYTNIIRKYVDENNLKEKIEILGKVSQEQVEKLYTTSDIFVFPSLIEGFGIPVLEAMNYGLPVVSSNKTVMPEVIGDAGILIEPTAENFANMIEILIGNPQLQNELIKKGYERLKIFSQKNFNQKLLNFYKFL